MFDYNDPGLDILCTDHQLRVLNAKRDHGTNSAAASALGTTETNVKSALKKIRKKAGETAERVEKLIKMADEEQPQFYGTKQHPRHRRGKLTGNKFLFTSAQNNTVPNSEMLDTLENMSNLLGAQLVIGGFTYDKRGFQKSEKGEGINYDPRLAKYMVNEQMEVADGLTWCGELNVLPTAMYPAGQFASYCGSDSLIIPHAKAQLESMPTESDRPAKLIFTTGACTQLNYIQKTAGQKAEWDHIFGAVLVEVAADGTWHARDLNFESSTGHVYDLTTLYTPDGYVEDDYFIDVLSLPDAHISKVTEDRLSSYLDALDRFNPRIITTNDTHDHARRNHHNRKDYYLGFQLWHEGTESVKEEVEQSVRFLRTLSLYARDEVVVVESNHDLALNRWLLETDYRNDHANALFFLEMQLKNYQRIAEGKKLETFKTACELVNGGELELVRFLKTDEPYRVNGVAHHQHGHNGSGGARGNIRQYAKLSEKYTKGHSHKAGRIGGVYENGVMMDRDDAGYVKGQDAWSGAFTLQFVNGKRQMLIMKDGKYCV